MTQQRKETANIAKQVNQKLETQISPLPKDYGDSLNNTYGQNMSILQTALGKATNQTEKTVIQQKISTLNERYKKICEGIEKIQAQTWTEKAWNKIVTTIDIIGSFSWGVITGVSNGISGQSNSIETKDGIAYAVGEMTGSVVMIGGGALLTFFGGAISTGGIVISATGVGTIVGAPAVAIGATVSTAGVWVTSNGIVNLGESSQNLSDSIQKIKESLGGNNLNNEPNVKDLKKLSDKKIKELGGEIYTQEIKSMTGKSKSDLYWNPKTGNVYSIPKNGGVPEWVDTIPVD